jgi:hypothetical protein
VDKAGYDISRAYSETTNTPCVACVEPKFTKHGDYEICHACSAGEKFDSFAYDSDFDFDEATNNPCTAT